MFRTRIAPVTLALSCLLGCAAPSDPAAGTSPQATAAPIAPSVVAVERAIRDLEVGRELPSVRTRLEAALADPALPDATRDEATLALARALDRLGEHEAAIANVEALLARHVDDHPWTLEERAHDLLAVLVTGKTAKPPRAEPAVEPAKSAHALAPFFPVQDGTERSPTYMVGGDAAASERLGTFAIADAIRAAHREACPLCEDAVSAHTKTSRSESWTRIPADRARYDGALVVFWFDLEARRIPARYDAVLPMPSADVVARLEKGEGLVAVKPREGAPPVILLAAPRAAQLADVEAAFAARSTLPTDPLAVPLSKELRPSEIRSTIRSARPAMKTCADALLAAHPEAEGKVVLKLRIRGDGKAEDVQVDAPESPALGDATFLACIRDATTALAFPATGLDTKVTYPIAIAATP